MTRLRPLANVSGPHLLYLWFFVLDVLGEINLSMAFFPIIILIISTSFAIPLANFHLCELVHAWLIEHHLGGILSDGAFSSISEGVS
jgi:hypothetical protein